VVVMSRHLLIAHTHTVHEPTYGHRRYIPVTMIIRRNKKSPKLDATIASGAQRRQHVARIGEVVFMSRHLFIADTHTVHEPTSVHRCYIPVTMIIRRNQKSLKLDAAIVSGSQRRNHAVKWMS